MTGLQERALTIETPRAINGSLRFIGCTRLDQVVDDLENGFVAVIRSPDLSAKRRIVLTSIQSG